ncbi:cytochrome P450 [Flammula alnicola]|nr:cytochrome P450 [Flammula alnicola]
MGASTVSVPLAFSILCLVVSIIFVKSLIARKNGPYPPGPKPKPFIGNMLDLPKTGGPQMYARWSKEYNSGIVFASVLGSHVLVINKREDAEELLTKRAAKYSNRPLIPILSLMGWDPAMVPLLRYGETWRLHRKIMQQNFNYEAAKQYRPITVRKVYKMLGGLLESPEKFQYHNKMLVVSIPLTTMYGYEVESIDDLFIEAAEKNSMIGATLLAPGGCLVNLFPFLRHVPPWFPGASSHKKIAEVKRLTELMKQIPMEHVKKQFTGGTAPPSLVCNFLEKKNTIGASKEEEMAIENIAFTIYGGAADTTLSATRTFFYQMATNPEIQQKAQAEIDRIIGTTRLPTFEDRGSLPYIEAIYRELMRWMPSLPLAVPHCVSEGDYYKGYFIPKETTVLPNIWAMTHDEDVYPDSFAFKPERFFDANGELNDDSEILAYGFGRRICVGRYMASSTVWLVIATVLACFNIGTAKDEFGNDIEINGDYDDFGLIQHKCPFKCSITPRSAMVHELIKEGNGV